MYKELKRWLEDKKILEELIRGLEERIEHKIQKELGIHATTFKELKIQCINLEDKFLNVLAKIENLDNRRILIQEELDVINRELDKIDRLLSNMSDIEKQVFRCRFIWGLSVKETAERVSYSEKQIKRITKEMLSKSKDVPPMSPNLL